MKKNKSTFIPNLDFLKNKLIISVHIQINFKIFNFKKPIIQDKQLTRVQLLYRKSIIKFFFYLLNKQQTSSESCTLLSQIINMQRQPTEQQYQLILKYMEATSQDDFQTATLILRQHNFNLNAAVNTKFGGGNQRNFSSNNMRRQDFYQRQRENHEDDQQVVRKYIQYIQKQNQNWSIINSSLTFVKNFTTGLVKLITQMILPESLLRKLIRSNFFVLYKEKISLKFQDDKLNRLLMNTKQTSHKACFLVISPNNRNQSIINLLNRKQIIKKIQQSYLFAGFVQGDSQIQMVPQKRPPQVVICRYNLYKQFLVLKRFVGDQQISSISVDKLNQILQQSRNHHKKDKNVLIKYRNFMRRQYYGPMYPQQQQQQEINFEARQQVTHQIINQNQQYRRIQQQQIKRLQQLRREEQKRNKQKEIHEEIQQQRKIRKMSIPDQPLEGDIIRFMFRCPDGTTKSRNFANDQKVDILYHWVQTNQQIELQDNKKRQFQILYSYPPTPLLDMKDKLLKQVFESDQQKLLIRQI